MLSKAIRRLALFTIATKGILASLVTLRDILLNLNLNMCGLSLMMIYVLVLTRSLALLDERESHCLADWLNQAGVQTEYIRMEEVGLSGNGHMMMLEENSKEIADYIIGWLNDSE
jgi:hypothetical protein